MRKWLAVTVILLLLPVAVAQADAGTEAAPDSPIGALKRSLVDGRGVRMSKTLVATKAGDEVKFWTNGVAAFRKGKITATDLTYRTDFPSLTGPVRKLTFDGRQYVRDEALPEGKAWLLYRNKNTRPILDADWIRIADPIMLKAVLATAGAKRSGGIYDGTRTTLYTGTITVGQLYASSPQPPLGLDEKPKGDEAKATISWQLWLGEDQLVRRVWGSWSEPYAKGGVRKSYVVDARLSDWGAATDIIRPPAGGVASPEDLAGSS